MKFACLFSGIGALTHGLREAGHEPILLVELEASARQCLRAHFPGVELHGDIFEVHDLPDGTELMTAGFPCSDVSLNNQMDRKGLDGRRTGLFGHVIRLLSKSKVPWVLMENVKGLLSSIKVEKDVGEANGPAPIEMVYQQLEQLGYNVASRAVSLPGFGLPHARDRVFILASLYGDPRDILLGQQGKGLSESGGKVCAGECQQHCHGHCYSCFIRETDLSFAAPPVDAPEEAEIAVNRHATEIRPPGPENSHQAFAVDSSIIPQEAIMPTPSCRTRTLGVSIDTGEKRSAPRLDLVPTLTTANPSRICLLQIPPSMACQDLPKPRYLTVKDVEVLFGLPPGWTMPATQCNLSGDDIPLPSRPRNRPVTALEAEDSCRNDRMRLLGGAVPVPFAKWIGKNLALPNIYCHKFMGDIDTLSEIAPGTISWPNAAFSMGGIGRRYGVHNMGIFPVPTRFIPILELIKPSGAVVQPKTLQDWEGRMVNVDWRIDHEFSFVLERLKQYCSSQDDIGGISSLIGEVGFIARRDCSIWPAVFFDPRLEEDSNCVPARVVQMYNVETMSGDARVALLLGYQKGEWVLTSVKEFLPFRPFRSIVEEARAADPGNRAFGHDASLFASAMQCADSRYQAQCSFATPAGLKTAEGNGDLVYPSPQISGEQPQETVHRPDQIATPAASGASPCTRCSLCVRRSLRSAESANCMLMVARKIAKQGHIGAAVSCMQELAIGLRIETFWAREGQWFSGKVESFVPESISHTIVYDDGDVEVLCLMNQHVRRLS